MTGQRSIPSYCLAILDIITQACGRRSYIATGSSYLVCLIILRAVCIKRHILSFGAQINRVDPSEELLLPRAVVRRAVTVTAVSTSVHHIPIVRSEHAAVVSTVVRVVEIGQTHYVSKLMAECTDTAKGVSGQLGRHCIVIQFLAAYFALRRRIGAMTGLTSRLYRPVMRPDGLRCTAISLTFTGIDDINEIYVAITIGVIVRPVDCKLLVSQNTSFHYCVGSMLVITFISTRIIRSIISHIAAEVDRTKHVKLRTVSTVRLVCKILTCRRITAIHCTIERVAQFIKSGLRMSGLHGFISEVRQNNDSLWCEVRLRTDLLALATGYTFRTACFRNCLCRRLTHNLVHAVDFANLLSVLVYGVMIELISDGHYLNLGTISLSYGTPSAACRYCVYCHSKDAYHH